jgi:hypothetical protein
MTSKHLLHLSDDEDDELGPAMLACSIQERRFVRALFEGKPGHGSGARAARAAEYGNRDGSSSAQTMARIANRLFNRQRVIDAMQECTRKLLRAEAPLAVEVVREVMRDRKHKDRLRAAFGVLERLDPVEAKIDMTVTHKDERPGSDAAGVKILRWLRDLGVSRDKQIEALGYNRLPHLERLLAEQDGTPIIEAEYHEVPPDAAE